MAADPVAKQVDRTAEGDVMSVSPATTASAVGLAETPTGEDESERYHVVATSSESSPATSLAPISSKEKGRKVTSPKQAK